MHDPDRTHEERIRNASRASQAAIARSMGVAFTLFSELGAGLLIGWAADRWLGTSPIFLLVFGLGGIAVAMSTFIRGALKENARATRNAPRDLQPLTDDDLDDQDDAEDHDQAWNDEDHSR